MSDSEKIKKESERKKSSSRQGNKEMDQKKDHPATNNEIKNEPECGDCKKNVADQEDSLQCEICELWFHTDCQNITKTTYNFLVKNARAKDKNNCVHWYCKRCDRGVGNILTSVAKLTMQQEKIQETVNEQQKEIDTLKITTSGFETRIKSNEDKIMEMSSSQNRNETVNADSKSKEKDNVIKVVKEVTKNINERLSRQKNIVVFRIPELDSNMKQEIAEHDEECVSEMCLTTAGTEFINFTCKRLGRKVLHETQEGDTQEGEKTSFGPIQG